MVERLLVPLDGSPLAEQALPWAQRIAQQHGAALHLVHVHTPNDSIYIEGMPVIDEEFHSLSKQHEQTYLDRAAQKVAEGTVHNVTTALLDHPAAPALLRYAARHAIDLFVLTSHGQSGFERAWLGSVADALIRNSRLPVLLLRPNAEGTIAAPALDRMLVPLDGSAAGEQILARATALGKPFAAHYTLLHVINPSSRARSALAVDPPMAPGDAAEWEVQRVRAAERYLDTVAERLRADGASVGTQIVMHERPATAILATAATGAFDLLAVATHGRTGIREKLLGSAADKVVRSASVPVLVYRPQDEA